MTEINRSLVKYQKIKHVFRTTSVQSGKKFLVEFTKIILGLTFQARSFAVIQPLKNVNSLYYLLWLKQRVSASKNCNYTDL